MLEFDAIAVGTADEKRVDAELLEPVRGILDLGAARDEASMPGVDVIDDEADQAPLRFDRAVGEGFADADRGFIADGKDARLAGVAQAFEPERTGVKIRRRIERLRIYPGNQSRYARRFVRHT